MLRHLTAVPDVLGEASPAVGLVGIAVLTVRAGQRWIVRQAQDRHPAAFADAVTGGDWERAERIAAEVLPAPTRASQTTSATSHPR